ncbi:MAG: glycosyltransferase family 39 protein [Candidatus Marinimicrobia bacterium]|nr:glycosyltransferase family 39 protein [Candidatus Neomarinimicrobiota bacterium]
MFNLLKKRENIILVLILLAVVVFCFYNLTTRPRLWFDEGINMEMAHNFLLFGKLDVFTAPSVFSGFPYAVGTNGYPLTIPLAAFYSSFGFGFFQTRILMLCWIVAFLLSLFFVTKKVFGEAKALFTVALVSTFAPFYGNGLTAFGEIPGFLFLLWGVYFLIREQPKYFLTGFLFALAASTKPSLYLLLFPSFVVFLLFVNRQSFFRKCFKFGLGAIVPIFVWLITIFPNVFSLEVWKSAMSFYKYPFGKDFSVWESFQANIVSLFTHSTLVYFLLLTAFIIFWFLKKGKTNHFKKQWGVFFFVYGFFAFLYFLKSPGWLRYLMGFEIFVFMFVPSAVELISKKIFKKNVLRKATFLCAMFGLVGLQTIQLFLFRSDFYSPYPEMTANFINEQLSKNDTYMVGLLNAPGLSALVPYEKKYHIIKVGGPTPAFGKNPLSFGKEKLPQLIAFEGWSIYVEEYKDVLDENYSLLEQFGAYSVYEIK